VQPPQGAPPAVVAAVAASAPAAAPACGTRRPRVPAAHRACPAAAAADGVGQGRGRRAATVRRPAGLAHPSPGSHLPLPSPHAPMHAPPLSNCLTTRAVHASPLPYPLTSGCSMRTPLSRTQMRSASRMVDRRCAMMSGARHGHWHGGSRTESTTRFQYPGPLLFRLALRVPGLFRVSLPVRGRRRPATGSAATGTQDQAGSLTRSGALALRLAVAACVWQ